MSSLKDCNRNFICQYCGKTFRSKQFLNNHINFKHNITCSFCNKGFQSKYYLKLHEDSAHNNVALNCKHCSKTFKSKYFLNIHTDEVHTGVSYNCVQCLTPFKSKYLLQAHVDRIHDVISYNCEHCSGTFKSRYLLKVHVDQTHNGMTYNCEQCLKVFKSRYLLRVHTGENHKSVAYNCELCSKSFKSKYYLMKHVDRRQCRGVYFKPPKNFNTNEMKSETSRDIATKSGLSRTTVIKLEPRTIEPGLSKAIKTESPLCETLETNSVTSSAVGIIRENFRASETECKPGRDIATNSETLDTIIKSSIEDFEMKQQVKPENFQDINFGNLMF